VWGALGPLLNGKTSAKSQGKKRRAFYSCMKFFCVPSLNAVSLEQSQQISKIETCLVLVLVAIGSHQNLSRHPSHFSRTRLSVCHPHRFTLVTVDARDAHPHRLPAALGTPTMLCHAESGAEDVASWPRNRA
jgi:hypothetical protein